MALLAAGQAPESVAGECQVSVKTVRNWASEARSVSAAGVAAIQAETAEILDGVARSREKLAGIAPAMVDRLIAIAGSDELAPAGAAAKHLLSLAGLVPVTKLEHSGQILTDLTLERIRQAAGAKP